MKRGKRVKLGLLGKSMGKKFASTKNVIVYPAAFRDLKIGDIVAVKLEESLALHYLIVKTKNWGITWGQNNKFFDGKNSKERFHGHLKDDYWQKLALVYWLEWLKIEEELKRNKIGWLVLKGPLWQKRYFGYFFNKPFSDFDILIRPRNYALAKKILSNFGWRIELEPGVKIGDFFGEISFVKKINPVLKLKIDLHLAPFSWTSGRFFQWPFDQKKVCLLAEELMAKSKNHFLKPTDWLFYACGHCFFNHNLRSVWPLAEMANVILNKKINWSYFWGLSKKYNCQPITQLAIYWVNRMFDLKNYLKAPGGKVMKLFVNEKTIFCPINPIKERKKNLYLNTTLRFLLWPVSWLKKAIVLIRFIFSSRFWCFWRVYLSFLPPLSILIWKASQWWRGRLFQLWQQPHRIFDRATSSVE